MTVDTASVAPAETVVSAVECVDLSYQFGPHLAVDHVNLSIAPGEMYGLLGPNGAGKSGTGLWHFFAVALSPRGVRRPVARARHSCFAAPGFTTLRT